MQTIYRLWDQDARVMRYWHYDDSFTAGPLGRVYVTRNYAYQQMRLGRARIVSL